MKTEKMNRKVVLSTLWIFVTLNYLYCDVMSLMDAGLLKQYIAGTVNGMSMTGGFLLGSAILMEIPIAMILLSRILRYKANRWINIIAAIIMTVVQTATLFAGTPTPYYIFCSVIEIAGTAFIFWYALQWREKEAIN
ncbi:MAG: DUF6326 family protein [Bacteroidota bacterium]